MGNAKIDSLTKEELIRARARYKHSYFMQYCWQRKNETYLEGIHTKHICASLDTAFENFKNGYSTFLKILVCFRQGKSEIVSRYLPAHFLGEFPDSEVILTSYSTTQARKFSKYSRGIIDSQQFRSLYPSVILNPKDKSADNWAINERSGQYQCFGMDAGAAGKGGALIVIDDYFGKRVDAESELKRGKVWETFTDDVMSRRADPCIVVICVTPWHVDDLCGRIDKKMDEGDEFFPKFETIRFPAFSSKYESGTLFPEKYSMAWYKSQKGTLSDYSFNSIMQCDPRPKGSNLLDTEGFKFFDELPEEAKNVRQCRAWDLASSEKQLMKEDPDYTVGAKGLVLWEDTPIKGVRIPHLYVTDIVRGRWEAVRRKQNIIEAVLRDGSGVRIGIEAFGAYKDAYTELKSMLRGVASVKELRMKGDKLAKSEGLEQVCESGNIYFSNKIKKKLMAALVDEFQCFPLGTHDDIVDAICMLLFMASTNVMQLFTQAEVQKEDVVKEENKKHCEDKDSIRKMAVNQGYVPKACTLPGKIIMGLVNDSKDPCNGCNEYRDICKGRPR